MPFPPIKTISPAAGWGKDWRLPPQRVLPLRRTPRAAYHWTADSIRRRPPAMLSRSKSRLKTGKSSLLIRRASRPPVQIYWRSSPQCLMIPPRQPRVLRCNRERFSRGRRPGNASPRIKPTHHCLPPAPAPLPLKKPRCCPALRRRNAEKRSALYGFRLPGRRILRFRGTAIHHPTQQHHNGNLPRRPEKEEIEPPHHFDKITCAGIDKGARHRRETGKQRKLGCGIAPVGCARNVGGKGSRTQSDGEILQSMRQRQARQYRPCARQPCKSERGEDLRDTEYPQAARDAHPAQQNAAEQTAHDACP